MPPSNAGTKTAKAKRLTQAGLNHGLRHPYATLHGQYTGYHSATIHRRAARTYDAGERTSQFLTHFSTALKTWYSSLADRSEIEVQLALVDNRYFFIGSNKNGTAEYLYDKLATDEALKFSLSTMADAAAGSARRSAAAEAFRNERHSTKFVGAMKGLRPVEVARNADIFGKAGKDLCLRIDACDDVGAEVGRFLSGALGDRRVMLVTSAFEMHAEQKILLALCKAAGTFDAATGVVFAGTFRPCRGCFESLSLVQRFYLPNLQFGSRPGHLWCTTTRGHVEIFNQLRLKGRVTAADNGAFDENGLLRGLTQTTHRPDLRLRDGTTTQGLHYGSDSDSDADSDAD